MSGEDDPFRRLGLPPRFAQSDAEIRERQRQALARVHPDRASDPLRRAEALRESASISAAARCLLDPRSRAEALLRGAGVDPAAPPSQALLMEMLEWRERLDEARADPDPTRLAEGRAAIEARAREILAAIGRALDGDGAEQAPDPRRGAELLTELRLVERLRDQAAES